MSKENVPVKGVIYIIYLQKGKNMNEGVSIRV